MNARAEEAATLAEVGRTLREAVVEVRLPAALADKAVAAWHRDDTAPVPPNESPAERATRHRAGTLALIGLTITERGTKTGDEVVVTLPVELAGEAITAAEEH